MNDVGKIVEGIGARLRDKVQIYVTSDEGNRVSGFIMGSTGRPTSTRERIYRRDTMDHSTGIMNPGGWTVISEGLPPKPQTITGKIRDMDVGDMINISANDAKIDVVRCLAARLNVNLDRKYSVSRTGIGCMIKREK